MQTRATEINFNPFWHVPPSLIKKDLIPKMKANPNYLAEEKIHILDKDGQEVSPYPIATLIAFCLTAVAAKKYRLPGNDRRCLTRAAMAPPSALPFRLPTAPFQLLRC